MVMKNQYYYICGLLDVLGERGPLMGFFPPNLHQLCQIGIKKSKSCILFYVC
jgi:hypothetical protein